MKDKTINIGQLPPYLMSQSNDILLKTLKSNMQIPINIAFPDGRLVGKILSGETGANCYIKDNCLYAEISLELSEDIEKEYEDVFFSSKHIFTHKAEKNNMSLEGLLLFPKKIKRSGE